MIPQSLIYEDSDVALETMRHIYLDTIANQHYQFKQGNTKSNYQASSSRYYTRSGKSTSPLSASSTNYRQLDDGIPDNDPENDTIVYQNSRDHHRSGQIDSYYDDFSDVTTSILCP